MVIPSIELDPEPDSEPDIRPSFVASIRYPQNNNNNNDNHRSDHLHFVEKVKQIESLSATEGQLDPDLSINDAGKGHAPDHPRNQKHSSTGSLLLKDDQGEKHVDERAHSAEGESSFTGVKHEGVSSSHPNGILARRATPAFEEHEEVSNRDLESQISRPKAGRKAAQPTFAASFKVSQLHV